MDADGHPLQGIFARAARGRFPSEGPVSVLPPVAHYRAAIVAFTGHTFIAADVDPAEVHRRIRGDPYTSPVLPPFVQWLSATVEGEAENLDLVLVAAGTGEPDGDLAPLPDWTLSERAGHGARLRREISGWRFRGQVGEVLIGRGLVDRWEVAYSVASDAPVGSGRLIATAARSLIPSGEPLFAQVAPGHARSLRATLAAGYQPIGSEVLVGDHLYERASLNGGDEQ